MRVVMSGMLDFLSRAPQRKVSSVFHLRVLLQDMVALNLGSKSRCVGIQYLFSKAQAKHLPSVSECIQVILPKSLLVVLIVAGNYF